MQISEKIFKAYDIRGIYPDEINEISSYKIGLAFIKFLKSETKIKKRKIKIIVGKDARFSSPEIFKFFVSGALRHGVDVIDIGTVSTDALYFALNFLEADGAAMITASHNPPEYNGIKLVARISFNKKKPQPKFICSDWGMNKIKEYSSDKIPSQADKTGGITHYNIIPKYLKHILSLIDTSGLEDIKAVIDFSGGTGSVLMKEMIKQIPINLLFIYSTLDEKFSNHLPDPSIKENLKDLQREVIKQQASFGLIFDGDGDRTVFVDEKGNIIETGAIIAMFSEYLLKKSPRSAIVYNLTCSKAVPEIIKKNKGKPIKTRTGHAFMKDAARDNKAIFGGEISGHFYYKDIFYAESGGYTLLFMLKILSENNKPLSEIIKQYKYYYWTGENNFNVRDRQQAIKALSKKYRHGKKTWLDGLTIEFKTWWFNVRESHTEPLLRVVVEANTKKFADKKLAEIKKIINSI